MPGCSDDALLPLFLDRAPSTLRRHLCGWQRWATFCATAGISAGAPALPQLLNILQSLADGCRMDRVRGRSSDSSSAKSVLTALCFVAHKLSLSQLSTLLVNPLVAAWKKGDCWNKARAKEALPLPLEVLSALELGFMEYPPLGSLAETLGLQPHF